MSNLIITISRTFGSNGKAIGTKLAKELGINIYDKNLFVNNDANSEGGLFAYCDEKIKFTDDDYKKQSEKILELAEKESCVIVGRCGDYVLKNRDNVIKILFYASPKYCTKTIMSMFGLSPSEAEKLIKQTDRERADYYEHYTGNAWTDFSNYDLCLNVSSLGIDGCVQMVKNYISIKN